MSTFNFNHLNFQVNVFPLNDSPLALRSAKHILHAGYQFNFQQMLNIISQCVNKFKRNESQIFIVMYAFGKCRSLCINVRMVVLLIDYENVSRFLHQCINLSSCSSTAVAMVQIKNCYHTCLLSIKIYVFINLNSTPQKMKMIIYKPCKFDRYPMTK